ncbi:MAG: UDP-N-acetylmuramoyl-L-alanine--D-glutamate ligase [Cyanobacteria bacterium]|nr:UDP-N-acetylmuramoyl-L-alanine--D-glutamate ligase [Cyanobacteriota bacterium]
MMNAQTWQNQRITILGLSKSGSAVARYVLSRGGEVFLSEVMPATPGNASARETLSELGCHIEMGGHSKQCYDFAPTVVVSPGIPPSSEIIHQLKLSGLSVISEVEFAYRESQKHQPPVPWVGVTGTNGKTTTTSLIAEIFQHAGYKAPACGNIGLPVADVLNIEPKADSFSEALPDVLIAELSSYQLEFSPTLTAKIAVFLNLTPDHLDWHGSFDAYERAKAKLFTGTQTPEMLILRAQDPVALKWLAQNPQKSSVWGFGLSRTDCEAFLNKAYLDSDGWIALEPMEKSPIQLFKATALNIIGDHNIENVLASVAAAWAFGISADVIRDACLAFKAVAHRLEFVGARLTPQGGNIRYYNDSKATNPEATISALRSFPSDTGSVVLIAGGRDKMGPLNDFVREVQENVTSVVLLGEATDRFKVALKDAGYSAVYRATDLSDAVEQASDLVKSGVVLFSPACASFDMFANFEQRGDAFKDIVNKIISSGVSSGLQEKAIK